MTDHLPKPRVPHSYYTRIRKIGWVTKGKRKELCAESEVHYVFPSFLLLLYSFNILQVLVGNLIPLKDLANL